ncbi:FAD/NAD(P)-binding protein [Reinekea sp.]|jgi:NAD(P)H-flavin reductase|uniref:FAD/NAD(P)-binding protein n=1 Tax=Reinekea sp. TaxID=1970455 RepID=UPI002A81C43E|nr:FAD/NAD(P)-binding protein [Reinekea sp.]
MKRNRQKPDAYLPWVANIIDRVQESPTVFTWRLQFADADIHRRYRFKPGQFNMVYLFGVGEIPISIASDPADEGLYDHTIQVVGRITRAMSRLEPGDQVGIRGPFGQGWPMTQAKGQAVLVITGGLGCAPVTSVINYVLQRRKQFGQLTILQGVKRASDMVYSDRYTAWAEAPNTQVLLAADQGGPQWPWYTGTVVDLLKQVDIDPLRTLVMACGPERMLHAAMHHLIELGLPANRLFLSMERNMQCAVGHCGHCQLGGRFVCQDGPVFEYPRVQDLMAITGY